jgi:hypothetical protein
MTTRFSASGELFLERNHRQILVSKSLTIVRIIVCGLLAFASCANGQGRDSLDRTVPAFESKGVGLTETLLKFSDQAHLLLAIAYVDRASLEQPIDVSLRRKSVRQSLDFILMHGDGYQWNLHDGIIAITNKHASRHANDLLNKVIPVFEIPADSTVQMSSMMLWWQLQITLDPSTKGFGGDVVGKSSTVRPVILHKRTVREILSYVVGNSRAVAWIAAGPAECLGFTPHCGLWYIVERSPSDHSYQAVLQKIRENL